MKLLGVKENDGSISVFRREDIAVSTSKESGLVLGYVQLVDGKPVQQYGLEEIVEVVFPDDLVVQNLKGGPNAPVPVEVRQVRGTDP